MAEAAAECVVDDNSAASGEYEGEGSDCFGDVATGRHIA